MINKSFRLKRSGLWIFGYEQVVQKLPEVTDHLNIKGWRYLNGSTENYYSKGNYPTPHRLNLIKLRR